MIIVDIWGGKGSQDHMARYILPMDDALKLVNNELQAGFLINLRKECAWDSYRNFDNRNC